MPSPEEDAPMVYALRIGTRAHADTQAILRDLAEREGVTRAEQWERNFQAALASLARLPRRCPSAPEPFTREVRQLLFPVARPAWRLLFTLRSEAADALDPPFVLVLHVRPARARPIPARDRRVLDAEG